MSTVPARRQITIRDLLTHTAGISYGTDSTVAAQYEAKGLGPAAGFGWYTADKDEGVCDTMDRLATLPFVAQPGEAYVYGYNTDILGCVVERASGMPLDRFIAERITIPLGLEDTRFFLPPDQRARLATVYSSGEDGTIVRAPDGARGQGHYIEGPRRNFSGGAGLLSTARDYARFLEMIRNGGALDGVRILSPRTVALMTTNQVGTLHSTSGLGFGLGFETVDRYGASGLSSIGAFGWGGAYGSQLQGRSRGTSGDRVHAQPDSEPHRSRQQIPHAHLSGAGRCAEAREPRGRRHRRDTLMIHARKTGVPIAASCHGAPEQSAAVVPQSTSVSLRPFCL